MASYINSLVESPPYRAFPTTHLCPEPTSTPLRDVAILLLKMLFIALLHSGIRSMRVSRSFAGNLLRSMSSSNKPDLESYYTHLPLCISRLYLFRSHYPLKSLSLSASAFSPLSHSSRADTNFDSNPWRRVASWICMLVPPVLMTCSFVSSFKNLTTGRVVDLPLLVSPNLVVAKIPTVSFLIPLRPC